jgi:hypothetical protein
MRVQVLRVQVMRVQVWPRAEAEQPMISGWADNSLTHKGNDWTMIRKSEARFFRSGRIQIKNLGRQSVQLEANEL